MDKYSYLNKMDNSVIEELFNKYKADPGSVDPSWRDFFAGFEFSLLNYTAEDGGSQVYPDEFKVMNLINGYRARGHLFTRTNPVRTRRKYFPTLDIENFGLTKEDLSREFHAGNELGLGISSLQHILDHLNQTYCQSIGVEYQYIRNPEMVEWLRSRMEGTRNTPSFDLKKKETILQKLAEAVLFEKFIHKKFPGHKSFSLEGVECLIPALDTIIESGSGLGAREFVIGMAHRGRLNALANILHKPLSNIFSEFDGKEYEDSELLGDVKYHLGFSNTICSGERENNFLILAPNPSHLEAVDPVVEGIARASCDHEFKGNSERIIPVLIHGDASISGQGIVYEVLQMSDLTGYKTGGTIHLVINNQLGFTTNYLDGRSSTYCTDVGKTILSPVFHVNADDVEAVVFTVQLATEFRQAFHKDVFIDLLGYRKYGHNESDEPRYTQPILYKIIESHPDPLEIYAKKLEEAQTLQNFDLDGIKNSINKNLEEGFENSKNITKADILPFLGNFWQGIRKAKPEDFIDSPVTAVDEDILKETGKIISSLPEGVPFFRKIIKLQEERREMILKTGRLDWAMGELLAYGTLLKEGFPIRLTGQDTQRGTFSHRHSVLTIEDSENKFIPLSTIEKENSFEVINSLLSEYGALGFEYGYALSSPGTLTLWEAQFGDFSNGAQVIIDQYISSAEEKWKVMNGIVLLLPHGYEGQGPEHSSARLERFLAISGHNNIQVVNCTTPANFFHVLRRQMHRTFRKPLVIFTPKSLLRHPRCVSAIPEFTTGGFREVLDDHLAAPEKIRKVVLCSGKLYYDLLEAKERLKKEDLAIVRIEQLYPLPLKQLREIISRYQKSESWHWIQEEPANMGAMDFLFQNFKEVELKFTARPPSGSPATGSSRLHKIQQQLLIDKAMGACSCEVANESCRLHCSEKEYLGR